MANPPSNIPKKTNIYLKYSGWGFTLFVMLMVALFGGQKLEAYLGMEMPLISVGLMLLVLVVQFYKLIKDLS
jgi:hypothetical protein